MSSGKQLNWRRLSVSLLPNSKLAFEKGRTSDEDWRSAFMDYGGSARNLLELKSEELNEAISGAVDSITDLKHLFPYGDTNDAPVNVSIYLVQVQPRRCENGEINRSKFLGKIVSRYVLGILLQKKETLVVNQLQNTFKMLFNSPARSASGVAFELQGHYYLRRRLSKKIVVRKLSDSASPQKEELDLHHVVELVEFYDCDVKPFNQLKPTAYYKPLSSRFAGIDSFVMHVVDKQAVNKTPDCVVMFQFTTSTDHPVRTNSLSQLRIPNRRQKPYPRWKLVFVVPEEIESRFNKAQPLQPPVGYIDQCVLGVSSEQLWESMLGTGDQSSKGRIAGDGIRI